MARKASPLTTAKNQLKAVTDERDALIAKLEATQKELESAKFSRDHLSKAHEKANEQLAQAHAAIDVLPAAPPRVTKYRQRYGGEHELEVDVASRLAGWLAKVISPQLAALKPAPDEG